MLKKRKKKFEVSIAFYEYTTVVKAKNWREAMQKVRAKLKKNFPTNLIMKWNSYFDEVE